MSKVYVVTQGDVEGSAWAQLQYESFASLELRVAADGVVVTLDELLSAADAEAVREGTDAEIDAALDAAIVAKSYAADDSFYFLGDARLCFRALERIKAAHGDIKMVGADAILTPTTVTLA